MLAMHFLFCEYISGFGKLIFRIPRVVVVGGMLEFLYVADN